jgi:hypothetical protein
MGEEEEDETLRSDDYEHEHMTNIRSFIINLYMMLSESG